MRTTSIALALTLLASLAHAADPAPAWQPDQDGYYWSRRADGSFLGSPDRAVALAAGTPIAPHDVTTRHLVGQANPAQPQPVAPTAPQQDHWIALVNGYRAAHGLSPVAFDPGLAAWARANNAQQLARGMGHFVMGTARRQNAGWGAASAVWRGWQASAPHRAALLDPTIRRAAVAQDGPYFTFSAN